VGEHRKSLVTVPFVGSVGGKQVEGPVPPHAGQRPSGALPVDPSLSRASYSRAPRLPFDTSTPLAYTVLTIEYALQGSRVSPAERRPY